MKYGCLPLLILSLSGKGQPVRFQLFLTRSCTTVEQIDTSYYVSKAKSPYTVYYPRSGTTYLPGTGQYRIEFVPGPVLAPSKIDIRDTGLYILKYKEPKIQLYNTGVVDQPLLFSECDSIMHGYFEDFYSDGSLKMRGNFSDGEVKDSLLYFFPNGIVERSVKIKPKTVYIRDFDSLGRLVMLQTHQNKGYMVYRNSETIKYFPNGKVESDQSSINHILSFRSFYPSGHLKINHFKKYRIEYYENGKERTVYTWKKKDGSGKDEMGNFIIVRTNYNEKGEVAESAVYEVWSIFGSYPQLRVSRADWIQSITEFKDGKKMVLAEDMSTEEYLKTHKDEQDPQPEL